MREGEDFGIREIVVSTDTLHHTRTFYERLVNFVAFSETDSKKRSTTALPVRKFFTEMRSLDKWAWSCNIHISSIPG